MANNRVFDISVMEHMLGADRVLLAKFAGKFLESARAALEEIDAALEAGDAEQLRHLGHRTKSAALTVGAQDMAALCLQLERAADAPSSAPVVGSLHAALAATAARMREAGLA